MLGSLTRSSFIFQRIKPFFLQPEFRKKSELRNMHFHTVYIVICVTGVCAWCRMVHPVIPPAQLWRFCKLTKWMFCRSHLNPFEQIWDVIDKEVRKMGPRNVRQLQQFDEWNTCLRYVAAMRSRCQAVIRANGGQVLIDKLQVSMEF